MAFAYTGGATANGDSAAPSITHGQTINSGDLVVAYVNSNSTTAISADAGGTTFTEEIDETMGALTHRHALYWKIAGGSEPSSYSFTSGDAQWSVIVKVFTSATDAVVDAAANSAIDASTTNSGIVCEAISGQVISDDALGILFGGKDDREGTPEAYTTADDSYVGVIGDNGGQTAAGAHRIYTTGETGPASVLIQTADSNDSQNRNGFSVHMSFVEGAAGGGGAAPHLTLLGVG